MWNSFQAALADGSGLLNTISEQATSAVRAVGLEDTVRRQSVALSLVSRKTGQLLAPTFHPLSPHLQLKGGIGELSNLADGVLSLQGEEAEEEGGDEAAAAEGPESSSGDEALTDTEGFTSIPLFSSLVSSMVSCTTVLHHSAARACDGTWSTRAPAAVRT